jgi:hypothetical protein
VHLASLRRRTSKVLAAATPLKVVDNEISVRTPTGTGYYRYGTDAANGSVDGYGDCYVPDPTDCPRNGQPWPTGNKAADTCGQCCPPQLFDFGVCAPGGTAAICSVDPATVLKVMDTLTPAGVAQSDELAPTKGPVVLHGIRTG